MNAAFVFIKPHANNEKAQQVVKDSLIARGLTIVKEGEFTGEQIDEQMLIDQHYYAIASKATLLKPADIPVPADKFEATFGLSWAQAQADGKVFNAIEACKVLGVDAEGLDALWNTCKKVKFGGGFYCGEVNHEGKTIYCFNAFFMTMRSKFVAPGTSIHYYVVEFSAEQLPWADFRGKVLGPTDPHAAPADSLRGRLLTEWAELGLGYEPTVGDNCVHASASPFEGLAERMNWLKVSPADDSFGAALIAAGISAETLKAWSVDPQVKGKSIFDQLEDTDAAECISRMVALNA
jgi:nucleoside diphosphate kinase